MKQSLKVTLGKNVWSSTVWGSPPNDRVLFTATQNVHGAVIKTMFLGQNGGVVIVDKNGNRKEIIKADYSQNRTFYSWLVPKGHGFLVRTTATITYDFLDANGLEQ